MTRNCHHSTELAARKRGRRLAASGQRRAAVRNTWHCLRAATVVVAMAMISLCLVTGGTGCQQQDTERQVQIIEQKPAADTSTRQYEKNAGPVINIVTSNVPTPTSQPANGTTGAVSKATAGEVLSKSYSPSAADAPAGHIVWQTISINVGNQGQEATGTATGSATATQTPSQASTSANPKTVSPEFTSAVPISVGLPGSAVSGSANAAGSGGTMGSPSANPTQTATQMTVKAASDQLAAIIKQAADLIAFLRGTTTQPE